MPPPEGQELQFAEMGECTLESGDVIRDCRIAYRAVGSPNADTSNVVLFPTCFGVTSGGILPSHTVCSSAGSNPNKKAAPWERPLRLPSGGISPPSPRHPRSDTAFFRGPGRPDRAATHNRRSPDSGAGTLHPAKAPNKYNPLPHPRPFGRGKSPSQTSRSAPAVRLPGAESGNTGVSRSCSNLH